MLIEKNIEIAYLLHIYTLYFFPLTSWNSELYNFHLRIHLNLNSK